MWIALVIVALVIFFIVSSKEKKYSTLANSQPVIKNIYDKYSKLILTFTKSGFSAKQVDDKRVDLYSFMNLSPFQFRVDNSLVLHPGENLQVISQVYNVTNGTKHLATKNFFYSVAMQEEQVADKLGVDLAEFYRNVISKVMT